MPLYPQTESERVQRLEEKVAQLEAALSRRGKLNVVQGGTLDVLREDGTPILRVGEIGGKVALRLYYPSGNLQMYAGETGVDNDIETLFYRDTGTLAMFVGGDAGGHQFAAIRDRSGNTVVSDDTISGTGIGVPYIPWGAFESASFPTDVTSSSTFAPLQNAGGVKMNPKISIKILARASDGTTAGEIRVVDEDGTQVGGTVTVSAGAFGYYDIAGVALPGTFKESKILTIEGRRTAGGGTIGVRGIYATGVQS